MEGWYDISTAPRDGTLVRLGWAERGVMQEWYIMFWHDGVWNAPSGGFIWSEDEPNGAPTHWGYYVQ